MIAYTITFSGPDGSSAFLADDQLKSWALQLYYRFGIQSSGFVERRANESMKRRKEFAYAFRFRVGSACYDK